MDFDGVGGVMLSYVVQVFFAVRWLFPEHNEMTEF